MKGMPDSPFLKHEEYSSRTDAGFTHVIEHCSQRSASPG